MHPLLTHPLRRWSVTVALLAGLLGASAHAALDTTARTDDHSINTPTDWWTYANQTPQQVSARLAEHGARLVGLEVTGVTNSGEPRLQVRMVANDGAYAVPGWAWYYDQTPAQITTLLNANTGRLIELERYDRGGGQIRYALVMVANSGHSARGWTYLMGATRAQIAAHIAGANMRPIDLDAYGRGAAMRHNAIFVSNTGTDQREFDWDVNQSVTQIVQRSTAFQGRVVKLGRQADDRYLFVQVSNTGSNSSGWWHKYGFASITALDNYARQMGARPIDVTSYATTNGRRFDAALIDNANATERRVREAFAPYFDPRDGNPIGIFSAYLKRVDGPVLVNFNGQRRAETASALKTLHLLHTMKQVEAGADTLASPFRYFENYTDGSDNVPKDRCPHSVLPERDPSNARDVTLERGLEMMMYDSDNRTTRGVVLRYGDSFAPFNATAAAAGMGNTRLRHNIGCAYSQFWPDGAFRRYSPSTLRNETTAADLARLYEGVWNRSLLSSSNRAREEFLEAANPGVGGLEQVVHQEANRLGKSSDIAYQFIALIRTYGKGGRYDTCLGDPDDMSRCGQAVIVRAAAGLVRLPIRSGYLFAYRTYSYARLISDVRNIYGNAGDTTVLDDSRGAAGREQFRDVIREALMTW